MGFYRGRVVNGEFSQEDPVSPLHFKGVNDHVLIVGSSGSGKSFFSKKLFPTPEGLMLFKPDPLFENIPLISKIGMPDPFDFEDFEVSDSYLYSLNMDISGIMASSLVPLLMSSLSAVRDLKNNSDDNLKKLDYDLFSFKENLLKNRKNKEEYFNQFSYLDLFFEYLSYKKSDPLIRSVSSVLYSHFLSLYKTYKHNPGRPRKDPLMVNGKTDLKLSFAGLGSLRSEYAAELLLRHYYYNVGLNLGTLYIDEFHHVSRSGSIVDTLLREFRVSGRVVGITQNLSDVAPSMLSNFGNIFISNSIHSGDLSYLSLLDPKLPARVSGIPQFTFFSLREYLTDRSVYPYYRWLDDDD